MSKAFTREDDSAEEPIIARPSSALPPGAKNYLTLSGEERLRNDLASAIEERARTTGSDAAGEKRRLQLLNQRIADLQQSLLTAEVVPPPEEFADRVTLGASVTTREANGEETTYRSVGVDEADSDRNWVSWLSPIARTLLNARLGEQVRFKFPAGEKVLKIVAIRYE